MAPSKKHQGSSRSNKKPEKGNYSFATFLSEAERLRQQAERKPEGSSREPLLSQCVHLLQQALLSHPSQAEDEEARFDLGEVYALWGKSVQAAMYERLGSVCSGNLRRSDAINVQEEAMERAFSLHRKSHEMYDEVGFRATRNLKQESLINSANSLCDCGDLCLELSVSRGGGALPAANYFALADSRYSMALSVAQDDVELLANFGDLNIKRAELVLQLDSGISKNEAWITAQAFYSKAMNAYGHACSLCDASVGDDLAGLLQNWGAGLLSFAERTPETAEAAAVYGCAMEKLKNAAQFRPTDVSVFIAIGEAYCSRAEQVEKTQAFDLLVCAIEEGFSAALKLDATCLDAIIGKGEAHLAAGKSAQLIMHNSQLAQVHYLQSLDSYMKVHQMIKTDIQNESKLKFQEQCDLLFNLACAAAVCNQEVLVADALTLLVQIDGISTSELAADPDLQSLNMKDWFLALQKRSDP